MENLVGSQKRKARKTKITHLVRTADGSVSPVEGGCWMERIGTTDSFSRALLFFRIITPHSLTHHLCTR